MAPPARAREVVSSAPPRSVPQARRPARRPHRGGQSPRPGPARRRRRCPTRSPAARARDGRLRLYQDGVQPEQLDWVVRGAAVADDLIQRLLGLTAPHASLGLYIFADQAEFRTQTSRCHRAAARGDRPLQGRPLLRARRAPRHLPRRRGAEVGRPRRAPRRPRAGPSGRARRWGHGTAGLVHRGGRRVRRPGRYGNDERRPRRRAPLAP